MWTTVAYVISQVGRSNCGPFGKGRDLKKMLNDLPINYEKFLGHHQHGSHIFFLFLVIFKYFTETTQNDVPCFFSSDFFGSF